MEHVKVVFVAATADFGRMQDATSKCVLVVNANSDEERAAMDVKPGNPKNLGLLRTIDEHQE